jgi:hypothetical protein
VLFAVRWVNALFFTSSPERKTAGLLLVTLRFVNVLSRLA